MPAATPLPHHLKPRREKLFGDGRPRPLDREAKIRIKTLARALMRRTTAGKHYGAITAKAYAVLEALLWGFHNARSGLCFPSYETIAEKAGCARSTVAEAIKMLEEAGLLGWVNRLVRVREPVRDLFGQWASRWRVIRTSNAYHFNDPKGGGARPGTAADAGASMGVSSKSERPSETPIQDSILGSDQVPALRLDPSNALDEALLRLGQAMRIAVGAVG